jgi:hypothetical protein
VNDDPQLAVADTESVTETWIEGNEPETDGVPLMTPVLELIDRPDGSDPVSENV